MNNQFYESLRNNILFKNTDIASLNLDEIKGRLVRVVEGEIVYREGVPSDFIFLIVTGQINIIKNKVLGKAKSYIYNENEFFGNDEYFEETTRTSTAIALTDSYLIVLSREEIENLVFQDNEIFLALRENLSGLFDNSTEITVDETEKPAIETTPEIERIITGEEIRAGIENNPPLEDVHTNEPAVWGAETEAVMESEINDTEAGQTFETGISAVSDEPVFEKPEESSTHNSMPEITITEDTMNEEPLTEEDFSILEEHTTAEIHPVEEINPEVQKSDFSLTEEDILNLEKSAGEENPVEGAETKSELGTPPILEDDMMIASLINQNSQKTVSEEVPAEEDSLVIRTNFDYNSSKDEDELTITSVQQEKPGNIAEPLKYSAIPEEIIDNTNESEQVSTDKKETNAPIINNGETGGEMNAQEVNKIVKAMELVNSNIKIDDLLSSIVNVATDLTSADRGTLYLVDKEKGELWSKVAMGTEPKEIRLKIGEGIAGNVAHTKKIENIKDVTTHPMFKKEVDKASGYVTKNMLCFPLKNKEEQVIGVLQLLNSKNGEFTEHDEEVLSMISINTAIALQNAEMVEKLLTAERVSSLGKMTNFLIQDIKKPVLVSKRYTEHLKSKNLAPEVTQLVEMILTELTQVADLVQTTSSYAEGKTILRTTITGINTTLQDFIGRVEQYVLSKHCKINFEPDKEINVKIDSKEFFQCFQHIVKNACDAMPDGGALSIKTKIDGKSVKISFEDQGLGIPESFIEKIFEPFMTHGKKEGAGLGLSITKKIVEAHQGKIEVKSSLGAGAEFTVTLPAGSSL